MIKNKIKLEVAYAPSPTQQDVIALELPRGSTIKEAIERSTLLEKYRDIDLTTYKVGVYGKLKCLDDHIEEHDRIEIYRQLLVDPKQARRLRSVKKNR